MEIFTQATKDISELEPRTENFAEERRMATRSILEWEALFTPHVYGVSAGTIPNYFR